MKPYLYVYFIQKCLQKATEFFGFSELRQSGKFFTGSLKKKRTDIFLLLRFCFYAILMLIKVMHLLKKIRAAGVIA